MQQSDGYKWSLDSVRTEPNPSKDRNQTPSKDSERFPRKNDKPTIRNKTKFYLQSILYTFCFVFFSKLAASFWKKKTWRKETFNFIVWKIWNLVEKKIYCTSYIRKEAENQANGEKENVNMGGAWVSFSLSSLDSTTFSLIQSYTHWGSVIKPGPFSWCCPSWS